MGGQACILYGGAECNRNADFAVLAPREDPERLSRALDDLRARGDRGATFESRYLERGVRPRASLPFRGAHVIVVLRRSDLEKVAEFGGPGTGSGKLGRPLVVPDASETSGLINALPGEVVRHWQTRG
jgi:hypothetical protein